MASGPIQALLVAGGKWHDIDFARSEILKLLGEFPRVRTRVAEDFRDCEALSETDFLVTYTCDLRPSATEEQALADFVRRGGRWFALHGTNSVMEFLAEGVAVPRTHALLMETLGSRFIAHPPIAPYTVEVAAPDHPLVRGIGPFQVEDELYLCEYYGRLEPLLETHFTGKAHGFAEDDWPDDEARLVMYVKRVGAGEVLYLTLGHCRGRYDMRPLMEEYPQVERGSWELPVFYELLRRGLSWASQAGTQGKASGSVAPT